MNTLTGRKIAILGLGASGESAARLARHEGGDTYVSEARTDAPTAARGERLRGIGVDVDLGRHDLERIVASDLVVASPGIPPTAPVLAALRARGVRWVSEPEFAFRFLRSPLIGVTGTNGKTTVAALVHHLLRSADIDAGLGGNIGAGFGPPASELVLREPPWAWCVWELSSYQLGAVERLRVNVGVMTNLAPDHLDRYDSVEEYWADKAGLFNRATPDSNWVLGNQPEIDRLAEGVAGRRFGFSLQCGSGVRACLDGETLCGDLGEGEEDWGRVSDLALLGRHNHENALAAALAARLAGASPDAVRAGLRSFQPLPHRLAAVAERAGVLWVDDSKATNVAATSSALRSLDRPLVVLLGGVDKGEDFSPLAPLLRESARAVILYGAVRERLAGELGACCDRHLVDGPFEDVVEKARQVAKRGDIVLLSPATASFDMFENYEHRGRRFRTLAEE